MRPTTLVTGASGLLGPYLVEAAARVGEAVGLSRRGAFACDLEQRQSVRRAVGEIGPDIVIHAAALTDVDRCEREPEAADRINRTVVNNLVDALPRNCRLVHISTDQVYPDGSGPYREGAEEPVNIYGRSKLAGERAALRHPDTLVLRTNLFGPSRTPGRQSLSDFVAESLAAGRATTLFRDVLFSPLHMATLARVTMEAVLVGELRGIYNLGSRDGMSKRDFGLAVATHLGLSTATVRDGLSTKVPARAPRPLDLRLDVRRIEAALGRRMSTLQEEIEKL